jgi:hypothetical protein
MAARLQVADVGVQRQYTGTVGRIENARLEVFCVRLRARVQAPSTVRESMRSLEQMFERVVVPAVTAAITIEAAPSAVSWLGPARSTDCSGRDCSALVVSAY